MLSGMWPSLFCHIWPKQTGRLVCGRAPVIISPRLKAKEAVEQWSELERVERMERCIVHLKQPTEWEQWGEQLLSRVHRVWRRFRTTEGGCRILLALSVFLFTGETESSCPEAIILPFPSCCLESNPRAHTHR